MDNDRIASASVAALPQLRFVRREGRNILQQAHSVVSFDEETIHARASVEWRDVPLVEE